MDALPLNVLDLIVLVVLLLSAVLAFFRGFVHETLGIAAWVGAGFAALYGLPMIQAKVRELIPVSWAADATAAVAIFLVTLLVLSIITRAIAKRVQDSSLGSLDRSLGVLFGLARGAFLVGLAYIVLAWLIPPADHPEWIQKARGLPLIQQSAGLIQSVVPQELGIGDTADQGKRTAEEAIELKRTFDNLTQPQVRQPDPVPVPTVPAAVTPAPAPVPAPAPAQPVVQAAPPPAPVQSQPGTPVPVKPPAQKQAAPAAPAAPAKPPVGYADDERTSLDRLFETTQ